MLQDGGNGDVIKKDSLEFLDGKFDLPTLLRIFLLKGTYFLWFSVYKLANDTICFSFFAVQLIHDLPYHALFYEHLQDPFQEIFLTITCMCHLLSFYVSSFFLFVSLVFKSMSAGLLVGFAGSVSLFCLGFS